MAWWEGVEETRLLIAPDPSTGGDHVGRMLSLRHPKTGNTRNTICYKIINGGFQELDWFKQSYGYWFVGDYVSEVVDAVSIMGEYLMDEPWLKLLCGKLR